MTFMTMTYELQAPLKPEQLRALASFANTYGLQKFRIDEKKNWLHFDYDFAAEGNGSRACAAQGKDTGGGKSRNELARR